jgi:hypothetical protein
VKRAINMARSSGLSLLLIADIGGYTKFMKLHRASLGHSQDITARLLNVVVEASPLPLIETEGDAAFFCVPVSTLKYRVTDLALEIHRAFHVQREKMIALNLCNCDACVQTRDLRLKFVSHVGEVASQTVGGRTKPVGVDVITVHRMLKNSVPVPEYLLMTGAVFDRLPVAMQTAAESIEEDLEGLGVETLHFLDLAGLSLDRPPPPQPALPSRLLATSRLMIRGFPVAAGLRKPRIRYS